MIRSRDLVLFIVTLLFLIIAITVTVFSSSSKHTDGSTPVYEFMQENGEFTVTSSQEALSAQDRADAIERLRAKLALSDEFIDPAPSVEAPVVEEETGSESSDVRLLRCLFPDDSLALVPRWPLSDVEMKAVEGARLVFESREIKVPHIATGTATSTLKKEVQIVEVPLLQLALLPIKAPDVSCVPSEVIGVTLGGVLIFNSDVNLYSHTSENTLIGFARDGFPIYGPYAGALDQCGGYDHPAGYRYSVVPDRDYIIGCFVAPPASFNL